MIKMTEENCLDIQFKLLDGLFFDSREETNDYVFYSSKVMDDQFWNIAYLKNEINIKILDELEKKFLDINRKSSLYLGRNSDNYENNKKFLLEHGYSLNDTDVYMRLEDKKDININIDIKIVETEDEYNDFMKVLASAYNDTEENSLENVYAGAITECYYKSIKSTINNDKYMHIIAYDNNIPVSVATLSYADGICGINSVGTAQGYWNKGYGKQLISYIVNKFNELGGNVLILSTEYNSKNQQFYEKLGFKEMYVMEQYIK